MRLATRLFVATVALGLTAGVAAQYQWRDENDRMVYSDTPPPHTLDPARILRSPKIAPPPAPGDVAAAKAAEGKAGEAPRPAADTPVATAKAAAMAAGGKAPSAADQAMAFEKRRAERADNERKQREKDELAAKNNRACEDMRTQLRTLEAGGRVSSVNAAGEREFMSDEERGRRMGTLRQDIASVCKG